MQRIFTAFGMTRRPGRSAANDPGLAALLDARADAICFVAKSWDYHVRVALETTLEDNLASIRDSVRAATRAGAARCCSTASISSTATRPIRTMRWPARAPRIDEGARWVVLCDTNGGTLPHEIEAIVAATTAVVPGDHLGIHAHNDTEQAVANSLAAVRAGARQIQGTLNGLGERCGNANLVSLIGTLKLKADYADALRDRRRRRQARGPHPGVARARRNPQPRSQPPCALCRRQRLRHQGRHPRLGDRQGPAPPTSMCGRKASATSASSWCPTRPAVPTCLPSSSGSASPSTARRPARRPPARRGQGARGDGLCLRGRRRLVRTAGAAHARQGAAIFRRHPVRRQCRAAGQRQAASA